MKTSKVLGTLYSVLIKTHSKLLDIVLAWFMTYAFVYICGRIRFHNNVNVTRRKLYNFKMKIKLRYKD
jgi:hypothetical protein